MKIVLVTESIPFPPRNGRELPTARIFEHLIKLHEVDLVVVGRDENDFQERLEHLPEGIRNVRFLPYRQLRAVKRITNELTLRKPAYFYRELDMDQVKSMFENDRYDFAWINPPGNLALLQACEALGIPFTKHSILGMNDLKSSLYADKLQQVIGGNFKWAYLMHWMRSFFIARMEKEYLKDFDLIHVQTPKEKQKTVDLVATEGFRKRVIDSPNGVKEFLFDCQYRGIDTPHILFMTHLEGERKYESKWFITKVWPKVKRLTNANLWLVGAPPKDAIPYVDNDDRIKVLGYVPDLKKTFDEVRLCVVPIFHGTGLINRIQDAMAAGVPVVASKLSASTFPDAMDEHHLLIAEKANEFANAVVRVYQTRALRLCLSINSRQYAKTQPNWEQTAKRLGKRMEEIVAEEVKHQKSTIQQMGEHASDRNTIRPDLIIVKK